MQRVWLSLGLACLWSAPCWAQLPVTDVANLAVNTKQAISQAVTSVQSVLTVANQVLDLTPLDELIIAGASWASDISELTDTLATAQLLFADVSSLHRQLTTLLDLETAPNNTSELAVRIRELRGGDEHGQSLRHTHPNPHDDPHAHAGSFYQAHGATQYACRQ